MVIRFPAYFCLICFQSHSSQETKGDSRWQTAWKKTLSRKGCLLWKQTVVGTEKKAWRRWTRKLVLLVLLLFQNDELLHLLSATHLLKDQAFVIHTSSHLLWKLVLSLLLTVIYSLMLRTNGAAIEHALKDKLVELWPIRDFELVVTW